MTTNTSETPTRDTVTDDSDGGDDSPPLLAELDEERKATLQIDEVRMRTVEPGLMKLPVHRVSTTEDSNTVTVEVEHPIEGEMPFHLSKPSTWDPENELVEFLDYYNMAFDDLYTLQTRCVYVDCTDGVTRDWFLTCPPGEEPTAVERMSAGVGTVAGQLRNEATEAGTREKIGIGFMASYAALWPILTYLLGVMNDGFESAFQVLVGMGVLAALSLTLSVTMFVVSGWISGDI